MPKILSFSFIILAFIFPAFTNTGFTEKFIKERQPVNATLSAQFTTANIIIDGIEEKEWSKAKPGTINIAMTSNLSGPATGCTTGGVIRSLWDGALLYLLIDVTDADITTAATRPTDKDGVEIYFDLWNDKFPKYEEDDGMMRISAAGELTGSGVYADRLKAYAASPRYNKENTKIGYTVELAIQIGGVAMKNGSSMGIDIGINDAVSPANTTKYKIFWSNGNNKGINDNSQWGNVVLNGYDGKSAMAIDTFLLKTNIKKAETLVRGIWINKTVLDKALVNAKNELTATNQTNINAANASLDHALKALRRKGKYKDPFDLPATNYLPDPFTFLNGEKVKTVADWNVRRDEIKDLVQYYEYGYMPQAPEKVTTSINGTALAVTVNDNGKTATFNAKLTVPTVAQCGKNGPYPVILSIDFFSGDANPIFLNAGYAVLSIVYSAIGSDNYDHKGAFYTLYPYDVATGHDVGTLLAWAWGASRGVDALSYLVNNDPAFKNTLDINKLVVTGFSRCGKAALAAGFFDDRFDIVSPGASGCGGAAVYRYDAFGNTPFRSAPFGNVYTWGTSPGGEVLGDKTRHQGHNANEMLPRFLNPDRIYKTKTHGYGERLPYDHHEIIAAIAPRAVLITTGNDDYSNNAEGDCIGAEAAKPVFNFLNASENIAINIRTTGEANPRGGGGGGHWLSEKQVKNLVEFADKIFFGKPLSAESQTAFYSNPYIPTFDKYYGGLDKMMPWRKSAPGR
ncbi:MAG: sugar-binding protein [Chitinophagaceae bacterium]